MGIDLGSFNRIMPQKFFAKSNIRPTFYKMSGVTVSQTVYTNGFVDFSIFECILKPSVHFSPNMHHRIDLRKDSLLACILYNKFSIEVI